MSDDNVISFPGAKGVTFEDIPAENILKAALEVKFQQCMVIGWTEDGMLYMAATTGYNPDNMAMLDVAKQELLSFYLSE